MKYLFVLSFLIVGCGKVESSDLRQEKIFTSYSAVYEEDSLRTEFEAAFSTSAGEIAENSVRLTGGSTVTLDGESMVESVSAITGYRYLARRGPMDSVGPGRNDLEFEYRNNNGRSYKNRIAIPEKITGSPPVEGSLSAGFSVPWRTDSPLLSSEEIVLTIISNQGSRKSYWTIKDRSPSLTEGRIQVGIDAIRDIEPQRVQVKLCRHRTFANINAPTIGGSMESRFCAPTAWILLR
jgi:hypothetical protein